MKATQFNFGDQRLPARFWSKVDRAGECWQWTAATDRKGYARYLHGGRNSVAHRVSYEHLVGPIPTGMVLDHRCRNRSCVRPDHLQAVTHQLNLENRKGATAESKSGIRGVYPTSDRRRWVAQVVVRGVRHYGGCFADIIEAEAAVIALRNQLMTNNLLDRLSSDTKEHR